MINKLLLNSLQVSGLLGLRKLSAAAMDWKAANTIYGFSVKNIDGELVSLEKYKGFVVVMVNVASQCGLTAGNYKELNQLYDKYESKGLRILAFPCNQFGGQEPGSESQIKEFMAKNNVKFDVFSKIEVNGENAHPLYKFLKQSQGGTLTDAIKWNFSKFLINKEGVPVKRYAPTDTPMSMEKDILALL